MSAALENPATLAGAARSFDAGDFAGAERACHALLAADPDDADALNLLGALCGRGGRLTEAIDHLRSAAALRPRDARLRVNLGNVLRQAGRAAEAETVLRGATLADPDWEDAWYHLALALAEQGRDGEANGCLDRVLALQPGARGAVALAQLLRHAGRPRQALHCYRHAAALEPGDAGFANNAGALALEAGDPAQAQRWLNRALELAPHWPDVHGNLGNLHLQRGEFDAARRAYERALALGPAAPERLLYQVGKAHLQQNRLGDAQAWLERAIAARPDFALARFTLATVHLARGDYGAGWPEYEWRLRDPALAGPRRPFGCPRWNGEPAPGRRLLVHAEQGYGDTLQFARFVPRAAERGVTVVLEAQPQLKRLLETLPGAALVLARGDPPPPCDLHIPLASLPLALDIGGDGIAAPTPYLQAPADAAALWRQRLGAATVPAVGLAWAGNPGYRADSRRSLPPRELDALLAVQGVRFVSLRKDSSGDAVPAGVLDYTAELHDFAETAALVANLDLVIAVDTAVAHLAGALGRPVWLLNRFDSDWRWMLDREDSPWYPTLRIFRQPRPFDWAPVTERVARELAAWRDREGAA